MSVVYAPPTRAPFGELGPPPGGGAGLVVRLRTLRRLRVEILVDGAELASADAGDLFYSDAWAAFALEVDAGRGVTLWYRHVAVIRDAPLPASWAPADGWRVGLGARAGAEGCHHRVRSLRLASPLLAAGTRVPVEVSFNSIDFSSGGPEIAYAAPPVVSLVLPAAGPAAGGSAVTLRGPGLCATLLRCRIGAALVNATAAACAPGEPAAPVPAPSAPPYGAPFALPWPPPPPPLAALVGDATRGRCRPPPRRSTRRRPRRSPPAASARRRSPSASLAASGTAGRPHSILLATGVGSAAPVDRPPQWGDSRAHPRRRRRRGADAARAALRAVRATGDAAAAACRFGPREVPATLAADEGEVRCTSPAAAIAVERTAFPAGTFNESELACVDRPLAGSWAAPCAHFVDVVAAGRRELWEPYCAFAEFADACCFCGGGAAAAAAATIGPTAVWVSRQGPQWAPGVGNTTAGSGNFTYLERAAHLPPLPLDPPFGPTAGATVVILQAPYLGGGDAYACRFGLAAVAATYDDAAGAVTLRGAARAPRARVAARARRRPSRATCRQSAPSTARSSSPSATTARRPARRSC